MIHFTRELGLPRVLDEVLSPGHMKLTLINRLKIEVRIRRVIWLHAAMVTCFWVGTVQIEFPRLLTELIDEVVPQYLTQGYAIRQGSMTSL